MDSQQVLDVLAEHKPVLTERYGVARLAPFGSVARGNSGANSDIDVLVAFDGPSTSQRYFGVLFYLEDLFGRSIDLVTEKALRAELRPPSSGRHGVSDASSQREWHFHLDDMIEFAERGWNTPTDSNRQNSRGLK